MGRPRKPQNINLPDNVYVRIDKRSGKPIKRYFYRLYGKTEKSLGTNFNLACLEAIKLNLEKEPKGAVITFNRVANRYKDDIIPLKKPNTQKANLNGLKPLLEFFNGAPLEQIKSSHIRQYLDWRKETKAAANNEYMLFHHIWQKAREWGYTEKVCPTEGVSRYPIKQRETYIDDTIFHLVYQYCNQDLKDLMDIAYLTGQRPIDVVNIRRSHILNGYLHIVQEKTAAKLRIEIKGQLKTILERRLEDGKEYLFYTRLGSRFTPNYVSNAFARVREHTAQKHPEYAEALNAFQFRDLRAKSGTDKAMLFGMNAAREHLGHTTEKMTKTYIRLAPIIPPLETSVSEPEKTGE
ncbi:integrase [Muribacter muris]|uniref:Integrase n=1 Tax=Muribacter muris TaxID=67855 RepID=A0A4Y9K1N5_9PAST|nr:tyrosine-type recombinase/integrase [Muribacter muris]MBF0784477.1 tyrosine-type recombinase/integrase [Muribacter muris]MBF0826227.1 tyrosine-type recombinase/integrase [Muribacter muris]TFV11991.1 integrase [Muribacter muris]